MNRTRRSEHEAALARRLELLGEEVASYGGSEPPGRGTGRHGSEPLRAVPPSPSTPASPPSPSALPRPGRHASRRTGRFARLLPEPLRGRVALGPGTLAVVAVVVAAGFALTAWWVVRSEPSLVAPVEPRPAPALASSAGPIAPTEPTGATPGGVAATPGDTVTPGNSVAQGCDGQARLHPRVDGVAHDPLAENVFDRAEIQLPFCCGMFGDVSEGFSS